MFKAIRDFFARQTSEGDPGTTRRAKAETISAPAEFLPVVRNAKNIALIGAIASAFTASFYLYLAQQFDAWQIYAMSLDVWVLAGLLVVSLILIRRGRTQAGIWLILASACLTFAVGPFMLSGWGLILGIGLAILITLVATQTLSGRQAERAIFLGAVFAVFIIVVDLFGPEDRLPAPQIMMFGLSAVVAMSALIFGINFVRQFQQFRVATRLTVLILMIALPVVAIIALSVTSRAAALMDAQANENLQRHSEIVQGTLTTWLELHNRALVELAALPDITSMDPARQRPALQAVAKAYPNLFLVQTTDLNGINVARNDDAQPKDYHDRQWFLGARAGAPLTLEVLISRTIGKPALNMSTPIKDAAGQILGVASIVSTLDDIGAAVVTTKVGQTGYVLIVDSANQVVAHPDPALTSGDTLHDFSNYPPVVAMRQGTTGITNFTDENGTHWRAYVFPLKNGWGIVAQEPEAELLAPQRLFQKISVIVGMAGLAALLIASWFAIHLTLRPIDRLTETVEAITAGDLTRTAEVTSQDEIGTLAAAFNSMTAQLRDLIGTLEQRVAERSKELERRANQLRIAAEVGSATVSVRDLNTLLNQSVRLLSLRFGFYHAGIFLLDENGTYAVLNAANSEGGQKMLRQGHKLEVGRVGIVGHVAETGQARIALDVGKDAVFFDNPDLPNTRSEMAIPLRTSGQIVGVLDIQSTEQQAFTQEDIGTLQIVADQLSVAIGNSRLLAESQTAVEAARRAYGEIASQAWKQRLEGETKLGFRSVERGGTTQIKEDVWSSESNRAATEGKPVLSDDARTLSVPVIIRGQTVGALRLVKTGNGRWNESEVQTIQAVSDQLGGALDSARLYDEAQRRAERERVISEITSKISSSINIRNVLQTAVEELGRALPGSDVIVQFQSGKETEQREY